MADNFDLRSFLTENKLTKNTQLLSEGMYYVTINIPSRKMDIGSRQEASSEEEAVEKAKKYIEQDSPGVEYIIKSVSLRKEVEPSTMDVSKVDTNSIEIDGVDPNDRPDFADAYISYAEYEDGTPLTDGELDELTSEMPDLVNQLANDSLYEKAQNKKPMMKETKLTAKERRLVEMVQKAMKENTDISTYTYEPGQEEDEYQDEFNPADAEDEKDYRRDQYRGNQIPEGEDMVQEKPMPKYESIDQLMKEIEHGTNEAAHKYKMEEMKRIYELLETKVTSLEEGENAEHIDQSKVKQMRKDIAALRKAEEKLRKEFEKKFNKKEKPAAAPKKEKEPVALAEGTFDLRKFLTENKITRNSRMLNEGQVVAHDANISSVERFAGKPLLGGYILDIKPGVANQVDIFISTEPDKKDGKQLRDFTLVGTATYSIGTRTSEKDAYLRQWTWKSALGQRLGQAEVGDRIMLKAIGDELEKDNQDLIDYTKD